MRIPDMISAGFALNVMAIIVVILLSYASLGLVFTLQ